MQSGGYFLAFSEGRVLASRIVHAMRAFVYAAACLLVLAAQSLAQADLKADVTPAPSSPPAWAYPINPPHMAGARASDLPVHVPDSDRAFRPAQLGDLFYAPDWHPADHPAMPAVVARGRQPAVYACAYCHLPDGSGRPENASLAGLPAQYIVQQLADFRSGARRTAVPVRAPPQLMNTLARSVTHREIKAAAEYFARLRPQSRIKVIETHLVPHTYVAGWFLAAAMAAPKEPIGRRIIEVPEDLEQFEHRDARSRILVYVPVGSVQAGEVLVQSGAPNRTLRCAGCHGADLKGAGMVPSIAGRSPSYIVRQLFDIQSGLRSGTAVVPMLAVVEHLTVDEMIPIAAYLATLN
jgi:cytochrome c553